MLNQVIKPLINNHNFKYRKLQLQLHTKLMNVKKLNIT